MAKSKIAKGHIFQWKGHEARVMAVADGYAMCRRPGCMPFVITVREVENSG